MTQIRLKNKTQGNSIPGRLVRVDPSDPKAFQYIDIATIDVIGTIDDIVMPGNYATINLINHLSLSSYYIQEEFETTSKNLRSYPYALAYGVDGVSTITYNLGGGQEIVKTFNYVAGVLTSIVLSGDTPSGIELTKTFSYTGDVLTGILYS